MGSPLELGLRDPSEERLAAALYEDGRASPMKGGGTLGRQSPPSA